MTQIPGQMSIFDICMDYPDINDIPEAEAVRIVGEAIGLRFVYNKRFRQWEAKRGRLKLSCEYGHYVIDDKRLFFGCGYQILKPYEGGGSGPRESIQEVIDFFREAMEEEKRHDTRRDD